MVNIVEIQTKSAKEAAEARAVQHRIIKDALEKLFKEGFNYLEAIKLIEADDLQKSKISKGQRTLIIDSANTEQCISRADRGYSAIFLCSVCL